MPPVQIVCRLISLSLLLALAAGCASSSKPRSSRERALTTIVLPEPLIVAPAAPLVVAPIEVEEPVVPVAPAMTPSGRAWPADWQSAWVPLESWVKFNGLPKPVQLSGGQEPLYQIQSSNGIVLIKIGRQVINFAGLQYGLGFAPRLFKGMPYIHSLDARKTLQALVETFFQPPSSNRTIVIDAGHGGKDSGTLNSIGHDNEKYFTLDWAMRLAPLLSAKGWNVVMTRTNDSTLTLPERVAVAERVKADLFLSLHFNSAAPNRDLMGVETYCLTPTGMPSNLIREFEDDPSASHPNNAFDDRNVQLASRLHRSILQSTGAIDRGVKRARFMAVLRMQNRPAVLIEGGYLSNTGEARRIATPEYRQTLAEAVASALD